MDNDELSDAAFERMRVFAGPNLSPIILTQDEQDLMENRQLIAALKSICARTGCGLSEAKKAIDMYRLPVNDKQALIHIKTEVGAALGQDLTAEELRAVLKEIQHTCNRTGLG